MAKKYRFALLGSPIAHSLSPKIHEIFAEGCGLDIEYTKIETDIATLKETVEFLKTSGYSGFNCTMPLKEAIIKYIDKKSRQCEFLGVCNTVKIEAIEEGDILFAHTTDGGGMLGALAHNGLEAAGKSVLVLGAGGT
ncbi:MAG: shikimate dehydrogenase, partial [Oscillospiraceae bacterium]|nr:shikimate dehydrogenase [Oscillospiraceae bacterium]